MKMSQQVGFSTFSTTKESEIRYEIKKSVLTDALQEGLIKIKDNQTFISFVHEFIDPIRFSTISKMNKNKQRILQEFKTNTEKRKIRFP